MHFTMTKRFSTLLLGLLPIGLMAQNVGINATGAAPVPSAMLDVDATNRGVLIPRVALAGATNNTPIGGGVVESLLVYNTATAGAGANAVTPGYHYWDGTRWQRVATDRSGWLTEGNWGTTPATHFVGTRDNQALRFRTNNLERFEISTGTATTGGHLRAFNNGTAAAPVYSWSANTNTGIFQQAANVIGFSTNGTERFRIPNANQVHATSNGTAALPFYSWSADTDMGIWRPGTNILGFSTAGVERMRILADGRIGVNNPAPGSSRVHVTGTTANIAGVYTLGAAYPGFGFWGYHNQLQGTGVAGAGQQPAFTTYLVEGSGGAFSAWDVSIYGFYQSPGIGSGMILQDDFGAQWDVGSWNLLYYKIIGNGLVSTVVRDLDEQRVVMVCPEAPEALFQDHGDGRLVNGRATVVLDPVFAKNIIVDEEHPLRVFVQLEGDCNGVFVTNKTGAGFDVVELMEGTSNVPFTWSVSAVRASETYTNSKGEQRIANYTGRFNPAPPVRERASISLEGGGRR